MVKKHLKNFNNNQSICACLPVLIKGSMLWVYLLFSCSDSSNDRSDLILSQSSLEIDDHLRLEGSNAVIQQIKNQPYAFRIRPTALNFNVKVYSDHCQQQRLNFQLKHFYRASYQHQQWFSYLENYPIETQVISEILDPFLQIESNQNQKYELSPTSDIFIDPACDLSKARCLNLNAKAWQLTLQKQPYFAKTIALSEQTELTPVQLIPKTACLSLSNNRMVVEHHFKQNQIKRWAVIANLLSLNVEEREQLFLKLQALSLDFLVINGDFSSPDIIHQLDELALPWFASLGDRDLNALDLFIESAGSTASAFDVQMVRLILLDTASKALSKAQYLFLENALNTVYFDQEELDPLYQQKPVFKIIISHIPPVSHRITDDQFDYQIDSARTIQLVKSKKAHLWLSSHESISARQQFEQGTHLLTLLQQGKIGEFLLFEIQNPCQASKTDQLVLRSNESDACVTYAILK